MNKNNLSGMGKAKVPPLEGFREASKKLGIAIYHADINRYPESWVQKCLFSMYGQAPYPGWEYIFYELNYGDQKGHISIADNYREHKCKNYAAAMNAIYAWIFEKCDAVANVNIDDWYAPQRLSLLLAEIEAGADIASSDYNLVNAEGTTIERYTNFSGLDPCTQLAAGTNVVSNPCHIMKKRVFEKLKFNPALVPMEDLAYWQDCCDRGFKIKIVPQRLHNYRLHAGQEGNKKSKP